MKKHLLLLGIFCFIASASFSQTQMNNQKSSLIDGNEHRVIKDVESPTTPTISKLPSDFPKFLDTGNSKNDLQIFHDAKQKWITENPERFEKIKHLNLNESIQSKKNMNYEK